MCVLDLAVMYLKQEIHYVGSDTYICPLKITTLKLLQSFSFPSPVRHSRKSKTILTGLEVGTLPFKPPLLGLVLNSEFTIDSLSFVHEAI